MDTKSYKGLFGLVLQCRRERNHRIDIQSVTRPLSPNEQQALFNHLFACGAVQHGNYWDFTGIDPTALLAIEEIKTLVVNPAGKSVNALAGTWIKDAHGNWRFSRQPSYSENTVSYDTSGHLHFNL